MTEDLLQVRDLAIEFRIHNTTVRAVDGVSFRIRPGSTMALVGESGSGKSVISQAIMGILPRAGRIAAGQILFNDPRAPDRRRSTSPSSTRTARDARHPRRPHLDHLPGADDLAVAAAHDRRPDRRGAAPAPEVLRRPKARSASSTCWRRSDSRIRRRRSLTYPFELSGGLRQRAMIAMALVCRPALLIADEPTTALDVTIQAQILKLLMELQAELGMAILLITHDLGVVANMAEEVVVMYRGEVMESGTRDDIFRDPQHPYLKALLRAVPRFDMKPGERLVPLREIEAETGHLLAAQGRTWPADADPAAAPGQPRHQELLDPARAAGSAERRNAVLAVDDVSFEIARGECLGLVGESGCGKTTLSKILMRALTPDSGGVRFNDRGTLARRAGAEPGRADALPPQDPVHLPGPVRLAQPAHDGVRHHQRAADHPRHRRRRVPRARWCAS